MPGVASVAGWGRAVWRGGQGDAVAGGVVAQVLAGGQGEGGGRDGGGGGGQELAGAGELVADGGAVAAEQGGDGAGGQVEPLVEDGGQDVAGEGDLLPGVIAGGGGPVRALLAGHRSVASCFGANFRQRAAVAPDRGTRRITYKDVTRCHHAPRPRRRRRPIRRVRCRRPPTPDDQQQGRYQRAQDQLHRARQRL